MLRKRPFSPGTTRDHAHDWTGAAHDGAARARARAQLGRRHELGDPVDADPGLRDLRGGAGGGVQGRDGPAAPRRLPPLPVDRLRARAASSSCSYAAVAMARSVFRKGADFTSAMAFQFASTNLVIELGIILAVLL